MKKVTGLKEKVKFGQVKENIFVSRKEHGICKGMGKIHKAIYLNWRKNFNLKKFNWKDKNSNQKSL